MEDFLTLNVLCSRSEYDTCHFAIRCAVCLPNRYGLVFLSYISRNKPEVYAQCFVSSSKRTALQVCTVAKEDYCMQIIRKFRWIRTHESEFWEVRKVNAVDMLTGKYCWLHNVISLMQIPFWKRICAPLYKSEGSGLCPVTRKNRWWVLLIHCTR